MFILSIKMFHFNTRFYQLVGHYEIQTKFAIQGQCFDGQGHLIIMYFVKAINVELMSKWKFNKKYLLKK